MTFCRTAAPPALLLALLFLAPPAAARPMGLQRDPSNVPPLPARQVLEAKGTLDPGEGRRPAGLRRLLDLRAAGEGALLVLPAAVALRGETPSIAVAYEGDQRVVHADPHRFVGAEGPSHAALFSPLRWLWSGVEARSDRLTIGPPTAEGGVRPPAGAWPEGPGVVGSAEGEDPYFVHLYAPADLDLAALLPFLPGAWEPDATRRFPRAVARPEGLPPLEQAATVHYLGRSKDRALFEFEVVTQGEAFAGRPGWRILRRSVGTILVDPDGRLFHAKAETTAQGFEGGPAPARTVLLVAVVEPSTETPVAGEEAPARAVARQAVLLREDMDRFRGDLLLETAGVARGLVKVVRPDAEDLGLLPVVSSETVGGVTPEPAALLALALLPGWTPALLRLGILDETARAQVAKAAEDATTDRVVAIGQRIVVPPLFSHDVPRLARAYAWATERDRWAEGPWFPPGLEGKDATAWASLDAAIAGMALGEATVGLTTHLALEGAAAPEAYGFLLPLLWAKAAGQPDGASIPELAASLAEGGGLGWLRHAYEKGDLPAATMARAWKAFPWTTKALLFPEAAAQASSLLPRAWALRGQGPTGATRIGALLTEVVLRRGGVEGRAARAAVLNLEDDAAVVYPEGVLWLTRWSSPTAADSFAEAYRRSCDGAKADVREADVVVVVGSVPDPEAVLRALAP